MTPERWEQLKQIFGDALEREPAEREAFVREAAQDDPELLSELLRLLEESDRDSKLLSRPALTCARALEQDEGPRFSPETVLARRFRIVRFIARGGMGEVYEAEDLELSERIALKVIRRNIAPDSELLDLFKKEVQLARRVTHPNVCRIFDLAQHEDAGTRVMLLSMELLDGHTLSEHLRDTGPLSFQDALPLIEEIAAGLQAVHDAGIIHGDLKPANVMVASRPGEVRPRAVVMDFGVALPVTPDSSGHRVSRGGTPEYFAPEQAQGAPVTTATDVYTFALMIADMLGAPRAARLQPDAERMPPRGARALRRCLEGEPSRRYSRPAELATALRRSVGDRRRTVIKVAAAVLVAAMGIPAAILLLGRTETPRGTASRQIMTEDAAVLMIQRPSPDGRFLAGVSWDTGDLVLRDVNSEKIQRLTHNTAPGVESGSTSAAIFSPDGRRIAYTWTTGPTDTELRLVGTDGTGQRTLYRSPGLYPAPLDWSPDGSKLLVSLYDHNAQVQTVVISTRDGSAKSPGIPEGPRVTNVVFSPGGDGFVYTLPKSGNNGAEIYRLSLTGAESTLVTSTSNNDSVIGWSPDRRSLIFSSDRRGQRGIWAISVSDQGAPGEPRELVPNASRWDILGITQTGALLYRMDDDAIDVYTAVLDLATGRTVSPPQLLMDRFLGSYAAPDWSRDGRRLVAISKHDPRQPALLIYELQSGAKREVQVDLRQLARPQWMERGASIMAQGETRDGVSGLFRIDPSTGKANLFMTFAALETVTEGVWSADSKIYFNRYSDNQRGIFRLNTETGERRVLYVPPKGVDINLENLALSPDGRTLAFHARNGAARTASLMLLPLDSGEARALLTVHQPEKFVYGSFAWTPDSRKVLTSRSRDQISEIWQVPVDGSAPAKIDFPAMRVIGLRLHPDGKTIAFFSQKTRSEIWMLQNFL